MSGRFRSLDDYSGRMVRPHIGGHAHGRARPWLSNTRARPWLSTGCRGCPPAERPWLSITHMAVHTNAWLSTPTHGCPHPNAHGCQRMAVPNAHGCPTAGMAVQTINGCPPAAINRRSMERPMAVRNAQGCPHHGRLWPATPMAVHTNAHKRRPWLSTGCRGCPPAERPWLSHTNDGHTNDGCPTHRPTHPVS